MDTKEIIFRIPKGWKRSIPFTFKYLWKKFHRVECQITMIPKGDNILVRLFGIKHGIYPGRWLEVFIDEWDLVIVYNDKTIYRERFYGFDLRVEYTSRDNYEEIILFLPDNTIFTYRYVRTEKINKLLTPKAYMPLEYNKDIVWKIMF